MIQSGEDRGQSFKQMSLETFDLHKQNLNLNTDFTLKKKKKN